LSSLTAVSECLHHLHLFEPWSRKIEDDMEVNHSTMRTNYRKSFKDLVPVLKVRFEESQVYKYGDSSNGKFNLLVQRPDGSRPILLATPWRGPALPALGQPAAIGQRSA
jgi:hypothetical protein